MNWSSAHRLKPHTTQVATALPPASRSSKPSSPCSSKNGRSMVPGSRSGKSQKMLRRGPEGSQRRGGVREVGKGRRTEDVRRVTCVGKWERQQALTASKHGQAADSPPAQRMKRCVDKGSIGE